MTIETYSWKSKAITIAVIVQMQKRSMHMVIADNNNNYVLLAWLD